MDKRFPDDADQQREDVSVSFVEGSRTRGAGTILLSPHICMSGWCTLPLVHPGPPPHVSHPAERRGQTKLCPNSRLGFHFEVPGRGSERASWEPAADVMACRQGGGVLQPSEGGVESLSCISTVGHHPYPDLKRIHPACVFVFCLILACDQNQFDLNPRRVSL